jgi:hypothetical protein
MTKPIDKSKLSIKGEKARRGSLNVITSVELKVVPQDV